MSNFGLFDCQLIMSQCCSDYSTCCPVIRSPGVTEAFTLHDCHTHKLTCDLSPTHSIQPPKLNFLNKTDTRCDTGNAEMDWGKKEAVHSVCVMIHSVVTLLVSLPGCLFVQGCTTSPTCFVGFPSFQWPHPMPCFLIGFTPYVESQLQMSSVQHAVSVCTLANLYHPSRRNDCIHLFTLSTEKSIQWRTAQKIWLQGNWHYGFLGFFCWDTS